MNIGVCIICKYDTVKPEFSEHVNTQLPGIFELFKFPKKISFSILNHKHKCSEHPGFIKLFTIFKRFT